MLTVFTFFHNTSSGSSSSSTDLWSLQKSLTGNCFSKSLETISDVTMVLYGCAMFGVMEVVLQWSGNFVISSVLENKIGMKHNDRVNDTFFVSFSTVFFRIVNFWKIGKSEFQKNDKQTVSTYSRPLGCEFFVSTN